MIRTLFVHETEAKSMVVTHDLKCAIRIEFHPSIDRVEHLAFVMQRHHMETLRAQIDEALAGLDHQEMTEAARAKAPPAEPQQERTE